MLARLLSLIVLATTFVAAHNVILPPYGKQCFFETLNVNDELAVSFQVGSRDPQNSEQYTVDFTITSPSSKVVLAKANVDHGDMNTKAKEVGKYTYCFSNERSGKVDLDVSFNVHGVKYVDLNDPNLNTLDYAIQRLADLTNNIKAEQSYLVIRERTHRNTAESTNSRVKWWSVFQLMVVVANSLFQIYYLRNFFEVKLVV